MKDDQKQLNYYKTFGINTKSSDFKRYKKAGLLEDIDEAFVDDVKQYWRKHYKKDIDPVYPIAFKNLTGKSDPRVAFPGYVSKVIVPFFNDQRRTIVYKDKNIYDKLIPSDRAVETILKRVHGLYFDKNDSLLDESEVIKSILSYKEDMIIKPSSTNNGEGIRKIKYTNNVLKLDDKELILSALEEMYGADFAVQKIIQQHPNMAAPHPSSVNSLRMVTLRWKNEVHYLLTFARFGSENKVQDNAGAGGVCVGVKETGEFLQTAVDEHAMVHTHHPTTGYSFKDLEPIPNFNEFIKYVVDLHKEILHHDFVSWDIVVGSDGLPVFLEANFRGAVWLYQMAAQQPLLGDLTAEIVNHVSKERVNKKSPRWKGLASSKNRTSIRTVRNQVKNLKEEKEKIEERNEEILLERKQFQEKLKSIESNFEKEKSKLLKESEGYKKELEAIKKSNSWKATSPLRKITSVLKKD